MKTGNYIFFCLLLVGFTACHEREEWQPTNYIQIGNEKSIKIVEGVVNREVTSSRGGSYFETEMILMGGTTLEQLNNFTTTEKPLALMIMHFLTTERNNISSGLYHIVQKNYTDTLHANLVDYCEIEYMPNGITHETNQESEQSFSIASGSVMVQTFGQMYTLYLNGHTTDGVEIKIHVNKQLALHDR